MEVSQFFFPAMPRRCFCGEDYKGHGTCAAGKACLRQELGGGHWRIALPKLQAMQPQEVARRHPGVNISALADHVARAEQRPRQDRAKQVVEPARRVWRSSGASSSSIQPPAVVLKRRASPERNPQERSRSRKTQRVWKPQATKPKDEEVDPPIPSSEGGV